MRELLLLVTVILASSTTFGQKPEPSPTPASSAPPDIQVNFGVDPVKAHVPETHRPADISRLQNSNGYVRPDAETRRKRFIKSTVHPYALGKMVASSGISTWRNSPEEWGPTWEGFGRRFASSFGRNAIKQTTKFGLDEAFKLDSHFYRSKSKSVGARVRNSLLSPVTARNSEGKRVFGFPNLAATYGSKIIAYEAWYPDRYGWKNGVRSGTFSLGFNVAFNLFKEFVWKKK